MYKLSNMAADDFACIYEYALLNFGAVQADCYTDNLESCLITLSKNPLSGQDFSEIMAGIRRYDYGQHAIFYRVKSDYFFIVRILHQRMNHFLYF